MQFILFIVHKVYKNRLILQRKGNSFYVLSPSFFRNCYTEVWESHILYIGAIHRVLTCSRFAPNAVRCKSVPDNAINNIGRAIRFALVYIDFFL